MADPEPSLATKRLPKQLGKQCSVNCLEGFGRDVVVIAQLKSLNFHAELFSGALRVSRLTLPAQRGRHRGVWAWTTDLFFHPAHPNGKHTRASDRPRADRQTA